LIRFQKGHHSHVQLDRTLVVGNQHLLPSTRSLVQSILLLGVPAENVILTGKLYSCRSAVVSWLREQHATVFAPSSSPLSPGYLVKHHEETLAKFWQHVLDTVKAKNPSLIVLLDDGGYGVLSSPVEIVRTHTIVAIEQTASGLRVKGPFVKLRRINVAASATKLKIESPIIGESIARAVVKKLSIRHPLGIVGVGNVGGAVAAALSKRGFEVLAFDKKGRIPSWGVRGVGSLEELCRRCSVIIGCTGEDVFAGAEWLGALRKEITLISGSSQDIEFRSVLRMAGRDPVKAGSDLCVSIGTTVFNVLFSGFPINFVGTGERESPHDIQLTRALLLGGVLQALFCPAPEKVGVRYRKVPEQLNSSLQRYIVRTWCRLVGAKGDMYAAFESLRWIQSNSGGKVTRCDELARRFDD
jgi:hypothetical protein